MTLLFLLIRGLYQNEAEPTFSGNVNMAPFAIFQQKIEPAAKICFAFFYQYCLVKMGPVVIIVMGSGGD